MIDTASAVQKAIFAKLNGSAAVTNVAPVFQHVPEKDDSGDDVDLPLVIIGNVSLEPIGGKDGGLDRATFEVITFVREPDQTALFALQSAVRNALEDQPVTADGALISNPVFQASDAELMEDGETYQGTQRFEVIAQPA